jgi:hypothetical protein
MQIREDANAEMENLERITEREAEAAAAAKARDQGG